MASTLTLDDEIAKKLDTAIKNRYPGESWGKKKHETKRMILNHITLLEAEAAGVK